MNQTMAAAVRNGVERETRDSLIYLDNNASTAPDPAVVEASCRAMVDLFANPSSQHGPGRLAAAAIDQAREQVAELCGAAQREVIFTSGATEADTLAICGLWAASRKANSPRDTLIVGSTEHAAVLEAARSLQDSGARVVVVPVDRYGVIDLDALSSQINDRTLLVSIMSANSETGVLTPVSDVVAAARSVGAYVHTDAAQWVGRLPFDMSDIGVDLVAISAHKMHGPKGVGALLVRRGTPLLPVLHGGGHERGLRSGTLNTPAIVGFGVAARLAAERFDEADSIRQLRDRLHSGLHARLGNVELNGHVETRLPNTVNLRFPGADAEAVLASLSQVACSAGSACHAGAPEPSHVLTAMGLSSRAAHESLRFSLSRTTTEAEVDRAIEDVVQAVEYVRSMDGAAVG